MTSNSNGALILTFNGNATEARVNEAMRSIAYANTSDAPPGSVQIDWSFSDGNAGTQGTGGAKLAAGSTTVGITANNDAPVVDLNGAGVGNDATASFTEQTSVLIAPVGTVVDADSASVGSLTATLAARPDGDGVESLALNAAAAALAAADGLSVSYSAAFGALSISGTASAADYE